MSVTIRGADKVTANMQKASAAIEAAVGDAVREAAMLVEREAKINQTPHVDSGRLRGSITSEEKSPLLFEVGSNVEYAAAHEFGTSKTRAYPYLGPAVETARSQYPDLIKEGIKTEVR